MCGRFVRHSPPSTYAELFGVDPIPGGPSRLGAGRPEGGGRPAGDEALHVAVEDQTARHLSARIADLAVIRSETRNQQGEVVQVLIAKLVVPRSEGAASEAVLTP